jgi:type IV pilus assembly protein PilW
MDTSIMIPKKLPRGFTLTEIMVALVISTILMAGVLTIMSSSKRTYALQSELSDLQENARFVMDEFSREIRMAGYLGCDSVISDPFGGGSDDETLKDKDGNEFPSSDTLVITSFGEQLIPDANENFFGTPAGTITLDSRSLVPDDGQEITLNDCGGSSVYEVDSVDNNGVMTLELLDELDPRKKPFRKFNKPVAIFMGSNISETLSPASSENFSGTDEQIELSGSSLPEKCDTITISDPDGIQYYRVTEVGSNQITLDPKPRTFNTPVTITNLGANAAIVYKVDKTDNESGFALYKCDNACDCGTDPKEIFVEGVENMQVRYGIDTDNNNIPNLYATTPTIPGYTTVTSVSSIRVTLLMRTLQKRFDLEGATDKDFRLDPTLTGYTNGIYNPQTDKAALESGYRHRMFTSTIKVRN